MSETCRTNCFRQKNFVFSLFVSTAKPNELYRGGSMRAASVKQKPDAAKATQKARSPIMKFYSMTAWLKTVAAKLTKRGKGRPGVWPQRRARLGLETLEARELLSGTPLVWTAPSTVSNTISLSVNAGQVQVWDNGVLEVSRAVTSISSITLNGNNSAQNTFDILSTPPGIATTIQSSKPSGYSSYSESVTVGDSSGVQHIQGTLTINGSLGYVNKITVDDSADMGTRSATVSGSSITGLAPATIHYSGLLDVFGELDVQGSRGQNSSYKITGTTPSNLNFFDNSASDRVTVSSTTGDVVVNGMAGDTASLIGPSSGTNVFLARPDYAILQLYYPSNDVDSVRVNGFSKVTAYSHSASDYAVLDGAGSGTNVFTAWPKDAVMKGSGYADEAVNFSKVTAQSYSTSDVAYLNGASSGTNTFEGTPADSSMVSSLSSGTYTNEAYGFVTIYGISHLSTDVAHLFSSIPYSSVSVSNGDISLWAGGLNVIAQNFDNADWMYAAYILPYYGLVWESGSIGKP
jgi:hypothetical protein